MKTFSFLLLTVACWGDSAAAALPAVETASTVARVSQSAAGHSFAPQFSRDGRYLLFVSAANNLTAPENHQPFLDVFVRHISAGYTSLISVSEIAPGGANDDSSFPAISRTGDRVVFVSAASDLVSGDTNDQSDIFLRDTRSASTYLISVSSDGVTSANAPSLGTASQVFLSSEPSISTDGRLVAFLSRATNLVTLPDTNEAEDIYLRNWREGTTRLVSVNAAGSAAAAGRSSSPMISARGNQVVFLSTATDLVPEVTQQINAVYIRHLGTETTEWVSRDLPFPGPLTCSQPVLSDDGSALVFTVATTNGSNFWLCHRLLESTVLSILATNSSGFGTPALSESGQRVAFTAEINSPDESSGTHAIYLWRQDNGAVELVSVSNTVAVGSATLPSISADGRYVSYLSDVPDGTNSTVTEVFRRDMQLGVTELISVTPTGTPSKWGVDPVPPTFHPDGLRVAFASRADDLVVDDLNQASDLFLRDVTAGSTELLTRRDPNVPSLTGAAPSLLGRGALGLDGRFILFRTFATNMTDLVSNSPSAGGIAGESNVVRNPVAAVIVRDRLAQTNVLYLPAVPVVEAILNPDGRSVTDTRYVGSTSQIFSGGKLVSERADHGGVGAGNSQNPAVSADGRLIAFTSSSFDLVPGTLRNAIYLRDLVAETNCVVSVRQNNSPDANSDSTDPIFSLNSRWVIFKSNATYLTSNSVASYPHNYFARDLRANQTILLGPVQSSYGKVPLSPVISIDSQRVAFNSGPDQIVVSDLPTGSNRVVCTNCQDPSLNADGTLMTFASPVVGKSQISVLNLRDGTTELVSVNYDGSEGGNDRSSAPILSPDGRRVIFLSLASDLVADDHNGQMDLFLRDLSTKTTFLLTPGNEGALAGRNLFKRPVISGDGQTIAFQSFAERLQPGDYNGTSDIFVLELGGGDSDHDGMADGWEMVYFDSLERDGNGDFDGDGRNDRDEFLAGTNPANNQGLLTLTAILRHPEGGVMFYWVSVPGRTYKIQARTDATSAGWTDFSAEITATSNTSSYGPVVAGGQQQFYRVVLQP